VLEASLPEGSTATEYHDPEKSADISTELITATNLEQIFSIATLVDLSPTTNWRRWNLMPVTDFFSAAPVMP
jgi:hypothetical protein